jgi:hypothetical protein
MSPRPLRPQTRNRLAASRDCAVSVGRPNISSILFYFASCCASLLRFFFFFFCCSVDHINVSFIHSSMNEPAMGAPVAVGAVAGTFLVEASAMLLADAPPNVLRGECPPPYLLNYGALQGQKMVSAPWFTFFPFQHRAGSVQVSSDDSVVLRCSDPDSDDVYTIYSRGASFKARQENVKHHSRQGRRHSLPAAFNAADAMSNTGLRVHDMWWALAQMMQRWEGGPTITITFVSFGSEDAAEGGGRKAASGSYRSPRLIVRVDIKEWQLTPGQDIVPSNSRSRVVGRCILFRACGGTCVLL